MLTKQKSVEKIKIIKRIAFVLLIVLTFASFKKAYFGWNYLFNESFHSELIELTLKKDSNLSVSSVNNFLNPLKNNCDNVFIDYSYKKKIKNNIKVLNINESTNIISLIEKPSILFLLQSLTNKISGYASNDDLKDFQYYTFYKLNNLLKLFDSYLLESNELILNNFIETIFSSSIREMNSIGRDNIIVVPRQNFKNYFEKKKYFNKVYGQIKELDLLCDCIDQVTLLNKFIYQDFIDSSFENDKIKYENVLITYHNDEKGMTSYVESIKKVGVYINSMIDFLTADKLKGDRYKMIRKININYKNFNAIDYNYSQNINILDDLYLLESALIDFNDQYLHQNKNKLKNIYEYNNLSIQLISKIVNSINKNPYAFYLFVSNYQKALISYVSDASSLEPVDLEYIDKDIKSKYYDNINNRWVVIEYINEL